MQEWKAAREELISRDESRSFSPPIPPLERMAEWSQRKPGEWAFPIAVAACLLFGLGARIRIFAGGLGEVNADEALVGLMALHLLDGEWSTFFWDQSYRGTIDVIRLAPVVARLGATRVALQVIPMLQSIVATILVWSVARRIRTGSRPAGGRPRRA